MDKQFKQFTFQTKVLDQANRIIEMVGSTEDFDRVGDRMLMAGVQLQNYLKNPIILPNHDYSSPAIGKALSVNIVASQLVFKIQFAETDEGKQWFYLYANGYMNASSIGFIGLEYKPNDHGGYDFIKWELLELSLVTVPCNPNAIQRAYTEGHISKALFNLIKSESEDIENMKKEEIEALIGKAVDEKVKTLETKHTEELLTKEKEIEGLNNKIKDLEGQLLEKSGATLSSKTKETLKGICEGLKQHADTLEKFVTGSTEQEDTEENDGAKEYTDEEINKMVEENITKILGGIQ